MAEDKVFTQEEVNKLVGQARLEGKEVGRKEFEGWFSPDAYEAKKKELDDQLTSLSDQIKTLTDEKATLQTQLTEKDGTIAKYEINSVKMRIAREAGLSYEAIDFLQGDNEEAIRKSAEVLKGLVKNPSTPPQFNPEQGANGDSTKEALKRMSRELKGE